MARKDPISQRGPLSGNNRSHALNATKRKFNLNLQQVTIKTASRQKIRLKVSTKTKKTLRKWGQI
ncbi:50S ribosomal protein L28 [Mycoplasma flocculare]|uniref:Large ribosomal subunit protein bL28 n=2 Tax=Mesomycoplasma flocculare TaxID=2128 RepID=A0A0A8E7D1_MESFC|nr:50S ribosomal protein L28 [Mesomycoplasma flocculare]MXR39621.1 50S ribosomal protein L28 [Mycoplasma sp. MF12]AJC49928.1 50S ribosomal protein L28 [Mesomycoplasma flocculare ATCC 27399]ENX50898.1 50S ribosomal protein L28 [Mesomycoplasma flocculare ATCC 27716]MXR06025.1 50S ribosomal protein L28 [Mesomycoplasma flocculare]MXR12451.1 50S ribosomal protein L28 [Mesomycoplasma flocculare]